MSLSLDGTTMSFTESESQEGIRVAGDDTANTTNRTKFSLITSRSPRLMEDLVNKALAEGWIVYGNMVTAIDYDGDDRQVTLLVQPVMHYNYKEPSLVVHTPVDEGHEGCSICEAAKLKG